jgi:hypothetical protein
MTPAHRAHDPAMLLRAVLLGYSQGLVSSRTIERACRDNVLFIAITGDAKPHFTTIAAFASRSRDAIAAVFAQVLAILGKEGNESAKLATEKGVIQGYSGVAVVDAAHQIIIGAQAHGTGAEQELLIPLLEACAGEFAEDTLVTADAGYHSEANLSGAEHRSVDRRSGHAQA